MSLQRDIQIDRIDRPPPIRRILLGGRHQGARRLLTPDLHRIESASSRWEMMPVHNKDLR